MAPLPNAVNEVTEFTQQLIRFDTSNPTSTERECAEWVAAKLGEAGIEHEMFESDPGRASVVAWLHGTDPDRPALLIHTHLDVVPADAADWTHPPFAGEIADGCVWGRGAVDMKNMVAMALAVARERATSGRLPERDLVLAFLSDEEAGGVKGAHYLVDNFPDRFDGVTEAIGEVGGYSVELDAERRLYLIETAQKGLDWMELTATGTAGHGSMINTDNAVTELAEAMARLGRHEFALRLTPTVERFLAQACTALGVEFDRQNPARAVAALGPIGRIVGATLRHTVNPTMLKAGYKVNVVPGSATGFADGRFLPGFEDDYDRELDAVLGPRITRRSVHRDVAVEAPFEGRIAAAMTTALTEADPGAIIAPYMLSAGTDAKSFSGLGIRCYGFAPLRLPGELDFSAMFHGVDERVPIDALEFGTKVLDRFLDLA